MGVAPREGGGRRGVGRCRTRVRRKNERRGSLQSGQRQRNGGEMIQPEGRRGGGEEGRGGEGRGGGEGGREGGEETECERELVYIHVYTYWATN